MENAYFVLSREEYDGKVADLMLQNSITIVYCFDTLPDSFQEGGLIQSGSSHSLIEKGRWPRKG